MTSSSIPAPAPTPTNDKSIDVTYGYGDTETSTKEKRTTSVYGLRVSSMQETLCKSEAVNSLVSTIKVNRTLTAVIVICLCILVMLLVGCLIGATIAIARLTKQTEIDSITGIMYSKESNSDHSHQTTMKTEDVVIYSDNTNIMDMTNEELMTLKEILLPNSNVKFQVKGYARGKDNTEIGLLVQGGTIIYDNEGLASATGDAKILLDLAYGVQEVPQKSNVFDHRRYLATGCSGTQVGQGSGASNNNRSF